MNNEDFAAYKLKNASNHGISATSSVKKLPAAGPGWKLNNPNWTYGPGAPDMSSDFRLVLQSKWDEVLKKKRWVLGEEWKREPADVENAFDKALEYAELKTTVFE